ncbi:DUF1775 domain-containing protein [Blastococcus sp. LR1]|uniref:DUF1775 domain-containing protein n=1 Tax=Blastococcus sp. LR1 TaxID=2877000 RepID=UPI001CCD349B|nr:DUF1775 domain-containing protein [Blastococcus sp. LR1]MCA0143819.1 YcnI family protein [Blastococcus sp. LR1]
MTTVVLLGLVLAGAGPASAHMEATAEGAQAGTGPVTVAFSAAAESDTAGIVGVKTQLPAGILPGSVSLASGPAGWILTPTADGYEIGGPAIAPAVDAEFSIAIARLPRDVTELPFKTLLRYSDGREDAWIELPSPANPEPENPAPTIAVAPAPADATTAATPSSPAPATPGTEGALSAEAQDEPAEVSAEDQSSTTGPTVAIVVLVAAALAGAFWFWRSRGSRGA